MLYCYWYDPDILQKNSRPNHPTTCGKVERFQQTLKKWLRSQPAPGNLTALQRLPAVGPALAARIVETRGAKPFATPDDLRRVRGIGAKTLETLRPHVCCE